MSAVSPISFGEAFRLWMKIGWLSFGGPAGQIALMHRELVERRRWISETRFLHALNYCMLLPGPEAQQLATYIGWLLHRTWGGIVAGGLFVLPGMLVMLVLSWLYVRYSALEPVAALFFGLKAAVLAVVIEAVLRVGRRALRNHFMVALAAAAFLAIYLFKVPFPWIVAGAAVIGIVARRVLPQYFDQALSANARTEQDFVVDRMYVAGQLAHARPNTRRALTFTAVSIAIWIAPVALIAAWLGTEHVLTREGAIFGQTAVVTFGGAYAVLAYIGQRAVEELHWLRPGEMIDGLAMAETTPGPLIMVLQFVGFLAGWNAADPWTPAAAGVAAALLTSYATFVPSFFFILLGAPYIERLRGVRWLDAALGAVTATVVGVILSLGVVFATAVLWRPGGANPFALAVMSLAALALWRNVGVPWIVLGGGLAGMLAYLFGWIGP